MSDSPKPGDYPIGSRLSRAAARMFAESRPDTRERIEFVSHLARPWRGEGPQPAGCNKEARIGEWKDCGAVLMRVIYVRPQD